MPSRPRVLGVDDNNRNLDILRKCFGSEFAFVSAQSGEEAIETAARVRPSVILLDVTMLGIDGYETCRRMRKDSALAFAKILMVSAKGSAAERLAGYEAGADDYVVKPFDPEEMLAKVRVYCRLRSLEEVNALRTTLLTLLAHETRTPLTLILSPASLLLDDPALLPRHRELIRTMESGARRLLRLVDRVSFLSDLRMGAVPLNQGPTDLGTLAGAAISRAEDVAREAAVTLTVQSDRQALVFGDPELLGKVVELLLDNAIRFSPKGETVLIRTEASGDRALLSVADRGRGIDRDFEPRLFQEYAVSDLDHHTRGHGLSLAIGRLIAELHDGMLRYEPGEGPGALFRLDLPLVAVPVAAA